MKQFGLYDLKLKLFENEKIIIDNYQKLHDFQKDYLIVDQYLIKGDFLKISKMDEMTVEIYGKIKEIKVLEKTEA